MYEAMGNEPDCVKSCLLIGWKLSKYKSPSLILFLRVLLNELCTFDPCTPNLALLLRILLVHFQASALLNIATNPITFC